MTIAIRNSGIPPRLSNTAGTFICNHILYQLGYIGDKYYNDLKFEFIHVPYTPKQVVNKPEQSSMSIENIAKGLETAINAINESDEDIKIALGETH